MSARAMRRGTARLPAALLPAALLLAACNGPKPSPAAPSAPVDAEIGGNGDDPLLHGSIGVERIRAFRHPDASGHFGVDAVRMPYRDDATGELRDRWLLVTAAGGGVLCELVADDWSVVDQAFWPVTGLAVPWSDVRAGRVRDRSGRERAMIYYVSRGSDQLQVADATDFPHLETTSLPLQVDASTADRPVKVKGAHTLQLHEPSGTLVLNGLDVTGQELPAPLTFACAPAQFYDVREDPMHPRRVAMFLGPEAGDQTLFDSQFLTIGGRDVWAPTIAQPLHGAASYFAFYAFDDAAGMGAPRRLATYAGPGSGTMHNVVQLPPGPDGHERLVAGFEAWAFAGGPGAIVSKAAVLRADGLLDGRSPQLCAWLVDDDNRRHAVHNPASRLLESGAHTWDVVPLAHFTGGYRVFRCGDDQDSVELLAHVPVSGVSPGQTAGRNHPRMGMPTWMACYNGAWDAVATPIGDFVSSTDLEASYLIEPSWGFIRQFGSYRTRPDGTVPRLRVRSGLPTQGAPMSVEVTGLQPGGRVTLLVSTRSRLHPVAMDRVGAIWCDIDAVVRTIEADADGETARFEFATPAAPQVVLTAWETYGPGPADVLKTPAAFVRLRPAKR